MSSLLKTPGMMERIDKLNRAQLVDDAMNLARVDQLPYDIGKKKPQKCSTSSFIQNTGYFEDFFYFHLTNNNLNLNFFCILSEY